MHAKYIFFVWIFFIFERLDCMHENNTLFFVFLFYIYIFYIILKKTKPNRKWSPLGDDVEERRGEAYLAMAHGGVSSGAGGSSSKRGGCALGSYFAGWRFFFFFSMCFCSVLLLFFLLFVFVFLSSLFFHASPICFFFSSLFLSFINNVF